jgi:hypothetical protein
MLKNERKINYMVGLAGNGNDHHRSWTGIQMNFWPLVHPCKADRGHFISQRLLAWLPIFHTKQGKQHKQLEAGSLNSFWQYKLYIVREKCQFVGFFRFKTEINESMTNFVEIHSISNIEVLELFLVSITKFPPRIAGCMLNERILKKNYLKFKIRLLYKTRLVPKFKATLQETAFKAG